MVNNGYTHPEYLVDAAWVAAHKGDSNVVVVDCDVDALTTAVIFPAR